MDVDQRLSQIEVRLKRQHEHLLAVIATQRERTDKAFDEMKLAMLEQELAARSHRERSEKAFQEVQLALLEQELATRGHRERMGEAFEKIRQAFQDQDVGVRTNFEEANLALGDLAAVAREQAVQLSDLRGRVEKLEEDRPPAA